MNWSLETTAPDLVNAIRTGSCVAFIGAGFSIPANVPNWKDLLVRVADHATNAQLPVPDVGPLLKKGSGHAFDQVAQLLQDALGRNRFVNVVREIVTSADATAIRERLRYLDGIPFRAILTTNFDRLLPTTRDPRHSTYESVLRPPARDIFELAFNDERFGTPVVKLHGDIDGARKNPLVLTRVDYRKRLYNEASYQTFLRSTLATTTVLYLGFSFTDAYLNELRSEVLQMLGGRKGAVPVAYAVANDVPPALVTHFDRHERIRLLSFDSLRKSKFTPFDDFLRQLFEVTNPVPRFARAVGKSRILWVDRHRENNAAAERFIARCREFNSKFRVDFADDPLNAHGRTRALRPGQRYDLVITHYGEDLGTKEGVPVALEIIELFRRSAPVVVFGFPTDAAARRRKIMTAGGYGYFHRFEDLFEEVQRILKEPSS